MMIELASVKAYLRVDDDDENDLIEALIEAALSAFEAWTNRTLVAPGQALPDPVGNALVMSKSIKQGALLLVGLWFANRESAVIGLPVADLPMSTMALWRPHRWMNI